MGSMGSTGSGGSWVRFAGMALLATTAAACGPKTTPVVAGPSSPAPAPAAPSVAAASVELPEGPGRQILRNACVSCHSLTEVTKFRGFYTRPQWRDIVLTMVDYGAPVNEKEVEVLSTYLAESLGKK